LTGALDSQIVSPHHSALQRAPERREHDHLIELSSGRGERSTVAALGTWLTLAYGHRARIGERYGAAAVLGFGRMCVRFDGGELSEVCAAQVLRSRS
jgi:hypothetical protein